MFLIGRPRLDGQHAWLGRAAAKIAQGVAPFRAILRLTPRALFACFWSRDDKWESPTPPPRDARRAIFSARPPTKDEANPLGDGVVAR